MRRGEPSPLRKQMPPVRKGRRKEGPDGVAREEDR